MRFPSLSTSLSASVFLAFTLAPLCAQKPATPASPPAPQQQSAAPSTARAITAAAASVGGKDQYAGESFLVMKSSWVYDMQADGTGYRERTIAVKVQSEASLRIFGVVAVAFASASEHVDMHYVRVRHADGTVTQTPVTDLIEQPEPVTREAPFYSDLKTAQLPVKDLRVGDTLEWQARIVRTRAEAPNQFWGEQSFVPEDAVTLDDAIELRVPAGENVIVWTNPRLKAQPKITTEGQQKVYRWHHEQLTPTTGSAADAVKAAKKTQVLTADEEADAEQGTLSSVAWTTFQSWADVGAWYRTLEGERVQPDDEIKARVAELIKGKTTDEDKARAIYTFVATNIRYVGVDFGVGRFQPHQAVDVLHNQYGDCKDKATLLIAMLRVAGFDPDAALIGANIRTNEAVPSPSAFNHLINRVKVGNDEVWLDATQEVAPYRVLLYLLRDKQALVIPNKGIATLVKTPKDLPFPSIDTWKAVGSLDSNGTSNSHITMTFHSDNEVAVRSAIHSVAPAEYEDTAQRFLNNITYAGTSSNAVFGRPEDTSTPYKVEVDYKQEKVGDWDNLKTLPVLPSVSLATVDEKNPPTSSIRLGALETSDSTSEMKLPANWTAILPEAIHAHAHWATYDQTYRFVDGVLYSERKVTVLESKVPASEWKDYKKWQDDASLGSNMYIQLIRPGADGKPLAAGSASGHISNTDAEDLIQKAYAAGQKLDDKTAEDDLKKAKALDPQARRLNDALGMVAMLRGKPNEAISDFRNELALYPQAFEAYEMMARAQWGHHDKAAAETTLRQWVASNPTDPQAEQLLAAYLLNDNQYPEAVDAATKALALTSADDKDAKMQRELLLGDAQMKAGKLDDGEKTLVALLKETDNAGYLNDAAYELADAKRQLPLDEEKVGIALNKLSAETQAWTLDEDPTTLRAKSNLLAATWDTMGWILFREGKTQPARTYIEAAWMGDHSDEVKKHLDQIADQLGQPHVDSGHKADQKDRTIALGDYQGPKVVAEYRLLLSHGKVERDKPTTSKAVGGADGMLKLASFADFFPQSSDAKLVRTGMLNCASGKCELILEP